jgi:hypothetical protein
MSWNSKQPRFQNLPPSTPPPKKFTINGEEYPRIPYGQGPDDLDHPTCDDCGARRGALHKLGCDLEPCPRCDGQAITCDCFYEDD